MEEFNKMKGTVKWFSSEKGYGFITAEENIDYYFTVNDVVGPKIPSAGSQVLFSAFKNKRGLQAKSIQILAGLISERYVLCKFCGKQIIPRVVFFQGNPNHSICPFCGAQHQKFISFWKSLMLGVLTILVRVLGRK